MRLPLVVAALSLALSVPMLAKFGASPSPETSSCCQIANDAIQTANQLKPGAKRRDVEKQFRVDGGVQVPESTRYVFAKCPYIKVQIDFDLAGARKHGMLLESPEDTVTKVSVPYLEYPAQD
jgi:hypothetical protein